MSVEVIIRCDECGERSPNEGWPSATSARSDLSRPGTRGGAAWERLGRKDYCPTCAESTEARLHRMRLHDEREGRRMRSA